MMGNYICIFPLQGGTRAAPIDCTDCNPCPVLCNMSIIEEKNDTVMSSLDPFVNGLETYVESDTTRVYIVVGVSVFVFLLVLAAFSYMVLKLKR